VGDDFDAFRKGKDVGHGGACLSRTDGAPFALRCAWALNRPGSAAPFRVPAGTERLLFQEYNLPITGRKLY
jgi:hypothetical protein